MGSGTLGFSTLVVASGRLPKGCKAEGKFQTRRTKPQPSKRNPKPQPRRTQPIVPQQVAATLKAMHLCSILSSHTQAGRQEAEITKSALRMCAPSSPWTVPVQTVCGPGTAETVKVTNACSQAAPGAAFLEGLKSISNETQRPRGRVLKTSKVTAQRTQKLPKPTAHMFRFSKVSLHDFKGLST